MVEQGGRLVLGELSLSKAPITATILVDLEPGMEAFDNNYLVRRPL
jgi:hypothetical protein